MDLATKKLDFLTADMADVDTFDLSLDGRWLAYVSNERGASALHVLDTATRLERPGPKLPLGVVTGLRWHRDGGASRPDDGDRSLERRRLVVGREERQARALDHERARGLNPDTFAEPELVSWKSIDGREITGFLYRPDPKRFPGKRPVMIDIHGGPEGQSRPGFLGALNYLVDELGVAIIFPNIRGSSGYGKTYLELDNGVLREGAYKDIGALLDWIRTRPDLDPDRVMVDGRQLRRLHDARRRGVLYSDRIRCAVDVVGISSLVTFLQNTSGYRRDLRRVEYGDERDPTMRAFLERTAPLNNAEKIKKPLFVIQGFNDPRVPRTESEQMVAKIRQLGTPVWYLMAKDEGHGFAKKSNRDYQFYATIEFMKQYLLN